MMETWEIERYYLLEIFIRSYNFNKTSSRENKGGSKEMGILAHFQFKKLHLKNRWNLRVLLFIHC